MPTTLHVHRADIGTTRLVDDPDTALQPDQVRLAIEYFALTANNITYAKFGDMLAYWDFYPVTAEWGNVPSMGYGRVIESNVPGIDVGGRYFGWWPMATQVDVMATPTRTGFRDDGAHRAPHAAVYREFTRTDLDEMGAGDEHRLPLLRGLFVTGFLADAFFAAADYFGAEQAIVLSASSKTALGYAASARATGAVRLVGLTSVGNADFVRATGYYDQVVTYDDLDAIASLPSVVVDMAGDGATVAAVHARLGDLIRYSMVIGKSHHDALPSAIEHGPTPQMFFAPGAIADRLAEWGPDEYQRRMGASLEGFLADSRQWLAIDERHGPLAAQDAWRELHAGEVPPSVGLIVSLRT